ncbi:MAG: cytochrome P460 family protein [Steroidobacteraceae bacterium]|nr:cytochrome P460 family protein [Steroidobacteraceae bacterium]
MTACSMLGLAAATPQVLAADLALGQQKSVGCQACHGASGISVSAEIPNLAGQKSAYLKTQLTAFRKGDRKNDLMSAVAALLNDADVDNVSAYWSSLPAGGAADAHAAFDPAAEFRKSRMTFPASFPREFVKYAQTSNATDKSGSRSYVNRVALTAAREKEPLPHGSIIVVENVADGAVASYAAMESRAGFGDGIPEVLKNGDWTYALFDGKREVREFNYAKCLACHTPKASTSYVFGLAEIAAMK